MSRLEARIETVDGFDDDARRLVEQLMGGKKKLQILSVVGMAGIGKTTLVKKVFNEPSIVYHFHVRAWTSVTQKPKKSDLLLAILKTGFNADIKNCSDMELSETLKRSLSGRRYMVVMDDIWDVKEWNNLMLCFPDDNVGSRIVFTSRIADMSLLVQEGRYQHSLHLLSEKESWDLLQHKVFLEQSCPPSLIEIGKYIARKCQGLPLSIVVIAGILASDTTTMWWSQVAHDMSSFASNAPEQYIETLVLSYNHLPDHLKPCFLYLTAFPANYEIPAWKLIMSWVAEGFVQTTENNLEEVATGYLEDLISRSMVIVSQRKSNGGIKACIIHDALRDLCIKKADEVEYLNRLPQYGYSTSSMVRKLYSREVVEENIFWQYTNARYSNFPPDTSTVHTLCMCIPGSYKWTKNMTLCPDIHSILRCNGSCNSFAKLQCWNDHLSSSKPCFLDMHSSDFIQVFRSLRVLDISGIEVSDIPIIVASLLELRYINGCAKGPDVNDGFTIFTKLHGLKYLETLVVHNRNRYRFQVCEEVWMLCSLRHLTLEGNFECPPPKHLQTLSSLQTLSCPIALSSYEKVLKITPNLRKLRINAALYLSSTKLAIPVMNELEHLENLSLQNDFRKPVPYEFRLLYRELSSPSMFPEH